jgi:hypothetical protein
MKTSHIITGIALSILSLINSMNAGTTNPDKNKAKTVSSGKACLELKGSASVNGSKLKDFSIRLYKGGKLVSKMSNGKKEKCNFLLEANSEYTICFSKKGLPDRMISINTAVPEDVDLSRHFIYEFEMEFLPESTRINSEAIDFPAGLIYFDEDTEKFEYSRKYAKSIQQLKKKEERVK